MATKEAPVTLAPSFNYGGNAATAEKRESHQQAHDDLHITEESELQFCWCMCKKCWDRHGRVCICRDCNCGSYARSTMLMFV